jgi:hypothetical protein
MRLMRMVVDGGAVGAPEKTGDDTATVAAAQFQFFSFQV